MLPRAHADPMNLMNPNVAGIVSQLKIRDPLAPSPPMVMAAGCQAAGPRRIRTDDSDW